MVINVGTGAGVTVRELIVAFEKVFGQPVPIREAPPRPGRRCRCLRERRPRPRAARLASELSLEEAIASALAWGEKRQEILGYE